MIAVLLGLVALLFIIEGVRRLRQSQLPVNPARLPFPPGPRPLPFIGNALSVNRGAPHLTYMEWSKTYGDIVYTRVLGQDIIVLNSEDVAITLLERRSQKYSDRPRDMLSLAELFGWEWASSLARYGPRFRLHRRLFHQVFRAKAAMTYHQRQLQKAYEMLTRLLDDPTRYAAHFTAFAAAVVMEVTYGYDMKGAETFASSMRRAADILLRLATPEISALCTFPFVKALPAWFPGMGFKYEVPECRHLVREGINAPYAWVKRRIEEGNAAPSMVADAITRYHLDDDSKHLELVQAIKDSAGTLYSASVETTNAILVIFVYLMMNRPDIQHRAQEELDRVVGRQRLPDFGDRSSLPYVGAVLREAMRWHPVAPLGVPHATTEDDVYQGYYVPRGATVLANLWAISRNEENYPEPDVFMPERFLQKDGTLKGDTIPWIFGFGRRICPGRHIGDASLWSAVVCMLALFKIEKTEGSENVEWTTGMTSHPLPFPCRIVPRDGEMDAQKLASLIYASRVDLWHVFLPPSP